MYQPDQRARTAITVAEAAPAAHPWRIWRGVEQTRRTFSAVKARWWDSCPVCPS